MKDGLEVALKSDIASSRLSQVGGADIVFASGTAAVSSIPGMLSKDLLLGLIINERSRAKCALDLVGVFILGRRCMMEEASASEYCSRLPWGLKMPIRIEFLVVKVEQ